MDLQEFILKNLEIDKEKYGRIFSFVDFGNVNYWYEKDRRDWNDNLLKENQKLTINIEKLAHFLNLFSEQRRFYYGWHMRIKSSWHIVIWAEKKGFIKITKPIQFIKHYIASGQVFHTLKDTADLYINAQKIKAHVVQIKETSPR